MMDYINRLMFKYGKIDNLVYAKRSWYRTMGFQQIRTNLVYI